MSVVIQEVYAASIVNIPPASISVNIPPGSISVNIPPGSISVNIPPGSISVNIPPGSSTPGCENTNSCYTPSSFIIFVGNEITWINNDSAAHTITSGTPSALDNKFDSGLLMSGKTFSKSFDTSGEYPYFCVVHPWMIGSFIVHEPDKIPETSVSEPINIPPIAKILPISPVSEGTQVTLDGSASYDPDNSPQRLTYIWKQLSGSTVTLSGTGSIVSFTAPNVDKTSIITFQLVVSDGYDSNQTTTTITINNVPSNIPPIAKILPISPVSEGTQVTLDGSASYDPDNSPQRLTYQWSQISGSGVAISNVYSKFASFIAPDVTSQEQIRFQLSVSDGSSSKSADVYVTVNHIPTPPVAVILSKGSGEVNSDVEFSGENSEDKKGTIVRYLWNFGDMENKEGMTVKHAYKLEDNYLVTLTVFDDRGEKGSTTTHVEIKPSFPIWIIVICVIGAAAGGTIYYKVTHPKLGVSFEIKTGLD